MRGLRIRSPSDGTFVLTPDDYITKFIASARVQLVGNQVVTVSLPGVAAATHYLWINEPISNRSGDDDTDPAYSIVGEILTDQLRFTSNNSAGVTQSVRWTVMLR